MAMKVPEVFSTSARDERSETDPSRSLTMREVSELRWRFCEVESDLGIRSTFGELLERQYAQLPSDHAVQIDRLERQIRGLIQKGKKPLTMGEGVSTRTASAYASIRLDIDASEEYIYMRAPLVTAHADPYENDSVFFLVRRLREIDRRRALIGRSHDRVLEAVYGNSTCGDDTLPFRKRFGDLVDVVVAIVNSQREDGDAPARSIVRAKLTDDSFARVMKHGASGYLRAACEAYAETRLS